MRTRRTASGSTARSTSRSTGRGSSSKTRSKPAKKDAQYVTIGAVWDNGKNGTSIKMDDYHGDVLFRDGKTGVEYKLKFVNLMEAFDNQPKNLELNLSINLQNPDSAEEVEYEED